MFNKHYALNSDLIAGFNLTTDIRPHNVNQYLQLLLLNCVIILIIRFMVVTIALQSLVPVQLVALSILIRISFIICVIIIMRHKVSYQINEYGIFLYQKSCLHRYIT